jgi:hypothetical protein
MSTCELVFPTRSTSFLDPSFATPMAPRMVAPSTVTYDLTIYELDHRDAAKAIMRRIVECGCVCRVAKQHEFPLDYYHYFGGETRFRAKFVINVPQANEAEVVSRIRKWLDSYEYSDSDLTPRRKSTTSARPHNHRN